MKKLIVLCVAILSIPWSIHAQWTYQYPGFDEHYEINYVDVVNQDLVWSVAKDHTGNGNPPMFTVTQNGGYTWQTGYVTNEQYLDPAMVFGFDALPYAFALLYSTNEASIDVQGVYATFDNGENWARQSGAFENPAAWPDIVYFWSTTWGVTIGDPVDGYFDIYTTNDLGATWQKLPQANIPDPLPGENAIIGVFDVKGSTIWFSTTKGRVYRSEDYGINWTVSSSPFSSFTRVVFKDNNNGWLQDVGVWESTQLAETTDGGETWQMVNFTGSLLNWDIDYIPGTSSTLVSSGAYLRNGITTSYDGGENWYYLDVEGIKFFKMDWLDWQTGWAGGYNENLQIPFLFKYSGPGVGDYIVYPLFIDFGDVSVGTPSSRYVRITNQSPDLLELTNIYSNSVNFMVTPSSGLIDPNSGGFTLEITFTPDSEGSFEGEVTIESSHPDIPEVNVHLMGSGFWQTSEIVFDPESFNETLYTGQTVTKTLSVTNNTGSDLNYQMEVNTDLSLGVLGWNYGSTPLDSDDGILEGDYDQAMFIKEFPVEDFSNATLYLGVDDGCRFWVNGDLVLDDLHGSHGLEYWNYEIDISSHLINGVNRITGVVFNGVFGGGWAGGFDCELIVDDVTLIKRGIDNYNSPEAMWYYYGQSGQQLVPTTDVNGKNWWQAGYGQYDWVLLSLGQEAYQSLEEMGWLYHSAPFGGNVLGSAPDNAQFIKDIDVGEYSSAMLYLGFDDGCRVWINGNLVFDYHNENHSLNYWNHEDDISGLLQLGTNRIAVEVYNGIYSGFGTGGFDCELLVDDEALIKRGDENPEAPEAMWYVYGANGVVQTPPVDASQHDWFEANYGLTNSQTNNNLTDLNWNFDSTPFYERPDILAIIPDNAQFIKDFYLNEFSWATVYLGFDDGCRVWINGNLAFDFHDENHDVQYWNHEEDVSGLLVTGRNRISVEVYNGVYGGGGYGGFDCQLIVDDVAVIKRGDENPGQPEAMWYYYGQAGQILTPPDDLEGLVWTHKDYGISQEVFTTTLSGIIADGQTQEIQVKINAAGLSMGEYQSVIVFTSENAEQETIIPVTLFVNSEGHLTINPSVINFGDYYIGYPESIAVTLKNDGFEYLNIISVSCNSGDISFDLYEYDLAPGESVVVNVTLESFDGGPFNSELLIQTTSYSSITKTVPIVANRMEAPQLVIENLEYMYSYLATGQSETQNLHISNWGGSPLTFTLPQANNKISVAGQGKTHSQPVFKPETKIARDVARDKQPEYYNTDITQTINLVKDKKSYLQSKEAFSSVEIFSDDMENGTNGWTVENYGEGSSKWHQVEFNSNSSETSWWCGDELTGTYIDEYTVSQAIISPSIKLPGLECTITLNFFEWYSIEEGWDQCFIDVSTNDGNDWIRVRDYNPGSSYGWINTTIDLSMFYGSEIKVRFFFDTGDEITNDFPGWFVDDVRIFFHVWDFLHSSPSGGTVNANEGMDIDVTFDATDYSEGLYLSMILIRTNDPEHEWFYLPAYMDVWGGGLTQQIFLQYGWSGISSYLVPENPVLDQLFSPVLNDLVILQNLENVYWPQEGVNTIGDWNYLDGYAVKMNNSTSLTISGTIPENRLIEMSGGWSLIPVLSMNPVAATDFDILESLNIIKDVAGTGIYWPVYNINTLQELLPGKSYLINTSSFEAFEYPPMTKSQGFKNATQSKAMVSPWNEISRSPITHIIAIPAECLTGFAAGDVIGIFTQEGYCAGFTTINNLSKNHSLVVFGDDPTTAGPDGLAEGENMMFRLMKTSSGQTLDIQATYSSRQPNQGTFTNNGLSEIAGFKLGELSTVLLATETITILPNPATDYLKITSPWPVSNIQINDSKGMTFLSSTVNHQTEVEMDVSSLPVGVYFVKIVTTDKTEIKKIIKK